MKTKKNTTSLLISQTLGGFIYPYLDYKLTHLLNATFVEITKS